jgi:cell division septal protein FtsQ
LAVKAIEVEGESRYATEDILRESGIYVGQSLLAVNKVQAHDALLKAFPYLEWIEVSNSSFDTIRIRLRETTVLGAVQLADGWMMLGSNNHGLERLAADGLPAGTLQIIGASLEGETVGQKLLDERSLRVCSTILQAAQTYKLEGITTISEIQRISVSDELTFADDIAPYSGGTK